MRFLAVLLAAALVVPLAVLGAPSQKGRHLRGQPLDRLPHKRQAENTTTDEAPVMAGVELVAPNNNIWLPLSQEEATAVLVFLHGKTELNLTASQDAGEWDNYIYNVDLVQPNKTAALDFLDGNGAQPGRYAKATVFFSATNEPYVQDLIVGPLPVTDKTTWAPMDWSTTTGNSRIRNWDADPSKVDDFKLAVHNSVADIVLDLLNGTYGEANSELGLYGIDPLWREPNADGSFKVINWLDYERDSTGIYGSDTLLSQGLAVKIDQTGRDPSKWQVLGWLWNNVFYATTDEFRNAWKAGMQKPVLNLDNAAYWTNRAGDAFAEDTMSPPLQIQPDGQRFGLDRANQYVKWNDFAFYLSFAKDTALKIFDIRYKGQRVVYELSLQEAVAHYAGSEPIQSGTSYLDGYYGFGAYTFELVRGFDCPTYAAFLDTHIHVDELTRTHPNAICLFEQDVGYPISRHSTRRMVYATKNIVLNIRTIASIGNYDYMMTTTFMTDGSIETVVQASGYIKGGYFANNEAYGYRIHDGLSGSMHDHVLTWKVDIDVAGTANTLAKHEFVASEEKYVWSGDATRKTMKLVRSNVENENDGKLDWTANGATQYIVENQQAQNRFGENRGYKIMPSRGAGMSRMTNPESSNLLNSMHFATHGLYVTQRKDTEPNAAHALNAYDCGSPLVDFSKFFNGESLVQQDIVVWVNLGMHHAPHSGDLPNTLTTTAQSAFIITPHNYLESDPSRACRYKTEITFEDNVPTNIDDSGAKAYSGTYDLADSIVDFTTYSGDRYDRKFPVAPRTQFDNTTTTTDPRT